MMYTSLNNTGVLPPNKNEIMLGVGTKGQRPPRVLGFEFYNY